MTTTIDSASYYTRTQALAAGVPEEALRGLRRHERDGQLLFSGEDLAGALVLAEEERRAEADTARQTERYPYGSLGPPTR